jgi:hypothetical protein
LRSQKTPTLKGGEEVREEFVLDNKQRGVKIITDKEIIYSMDYYEQINIKPDCINKISIKDVELCYFNITEKCRGLIAITPNAIEIISLRYFMDIKDNDSKMNENMIYNNCIELLNNFKLNYKKEQNP